jgi:hypothetical protein
MATPEDATRLMALCRALDSAQLHPVAQHLAALIQHQQIRPESRLNIAANQLRNKGDNPGSHAAIAAAQLLLAVMQLNQLSNPSEE